MSESDFSLPPPTFEFLVFSLKTQAEMQLGLFGLGEEKQEQPDLPAARHAIDMLAMIQEKTRGNLSLEEQRQIENSLSSHSTYSGYIECSNTGKVSLLLSCNLNLSLLLNNCCHL